MSGTCQPTGIGLGLDSPCEHHKLEVRPNEWTWRERCISIRNELRTMKPGYGNLEGKSRNPVITFLIKRHAELRITPLRLHRLAATPDSERELLKRRGLHKRSLRTYICNCGTAAVCRVSGSMSLDRVQSKKLLRRSSEVEMMELLIEVEWRWWTGCGRKSGERPPSSISRDAGNLP